MRMGGVKNYLVRERPVPVLKAIEKRVSSFVSAGFKSHLSKKSQGDFFDLGEKVNCGFFFLNPALIR